MSPLTEALIINGAVLIAVLEGDLGPHRKIGKLRILRPLITVAIVIPLFIDSPVTHGNGLLVELAGLAAGLLCGAVVAALMRVHRSPKTGQPVSAAGFPYALVWIVIVGAIGSLVIGLAFGAVTRLQERNGALWAQLPLRGLWLWVALIGWRALVMVLAAKSGAHVAASTTPLLFTLGLNRLGQAAVIATRAMAAGIAFAPEKDGRTFLSGGLNGRGRDHSARY